MKKRNLLILFLCLPFFNYAQLQNPNWKLFSSVNYAGYLEFNGDTLWMSQGQSAGGGLTRFIPSTGEILNLNITSTNLPSNEVSSIAFGNNNLVFIGSNTGVYSWDGNHFQLIRANATYANNQIHPENVIADDAGNVWFTLYASNAGNRLELYRYDGQNVVKIDSLNSNLPNNFLHILYKSRWGDIYIVAGSTLMKYDGYDWQPTGVNNTILTTAFRMCIDANDHIWTYGSNKTLHRYDGVTWTAIPTNVYPFQVNRGIGQIVADDSGYVYMPHGKIIKTDGTNWIVHDSDNTPYLSLVSTVKVDPAGNVWYDDITYGLVKTDFNNFDFYDKEEYQLRDFYEQIAIGKNNEIWLGTGYGYYKYKDSVWTFFNSFPNQTYDMRGICVDTNNVFWGLLNFYNSLPSDPQFVVNNDTTWTFEGTNIEFGWELTCDKNNVKWFANQLGLNKYENGVITTYPMGVNVIEDIDWIFVDRNNKLWLSEYAGTYLQTFDGVNWQTLSLGSLGFSVTRCAAITEDNQGNIYLATHGPQYNDAMQIGRFNGIDFDIINTTVAGYPRKIVFDKFNNLWATDILKGVSKFQDGIWINYNVNNSGIASNNLLDMKVDNYNNIWMVAPYAGVFIYNENGIDFTTVPEALLTIGGHCFFDIDSNGVKATNEPFLPYQQINVLDNSQSTFANSSGAYQLHLEEGAYTIAVQPQTSWHVTTDSLSYHISLDGSIVYDSLDFGISASRFHASSGGMNAGLPRCGFTVPYWINYTNTGSAIENGMIAFTPDTSSQFISAQPAPDSISGNTYFWKYTNLNPFASVQIVLQIAIYNFGIDPYYDGTAYVTDVSSYGYYDDDNFFVWNESDTLHQLVRCAFDPNEKQVSPEGLGLQHSISNSDILEYIIHFQNVGNDTAFFVKVIDTLDTHLDPLSVQVVSASHAYIYSGKNGILNFNFPNCNLPDSSVDYSASCGYIRFRVRQKSNFTLPAVITNKANIYFNFNAPIQTNETYNTVVPVSIEEAGSVKKLLLIFPNPSSDFISIKSISGFSISEIKIIDGTGKIQWKKNCNNYLINADIKSLSNGIYFMEVTLSNGKQVMEKFTVLH